MLSAFVVTTFFSPSQRPHYRGFRAGLVLQLVAIVVVLAVNGLIILWLQHTDRAPSSLVSWAITLAAADASLWIMLALLARHVVQPFLRMRHVILHASVLLADQRGSLPGTPFNLRELAGMMAQFAAAAQEAYLLCRSLENELASARTLMAQVLLQQQAIINSTNRELVEQYRSVLAYANYLDEHIQQHRSDAQLRYDFDDVCESGFNLKLIAHSLELTRSHVSQPSPVPLSGLLEQTVLALAPSLERRMMKLSSTGLDEAVVAMADATLLSHAVWMMMLGTIRYAAPESTLRLRCIPSMGIRPLSASSSVNSRRASLLPRNAMPTCCDR